MNYILCHLVNKQLMYIRRNRDGRWGEQFRTVFLVCLIGNGEFEGVGCIEELEVGEWLHIKLCLDLTNVTGSRELGGHYYDVSYLYW